MNGEHTYHILVADDDPDIRRYVAIVLERAGYKVSVAADGDAALKLAREQSPDLLLLDVAMPGQDGVEVCRAIQADWHVPPPVIFLTAAGHTQARVAGLDAGAVDYISKPFELEELRARVRAALRTKARRDELLIEATTDALTGLPNRRHLDIRATELFALAKRHQRPLACLMIDIDHFKQVNDTFGHAAGDAVLRHVAARLSPIRRTSDILGRYGGEEFAMFLPETEAAGALAVAEKIRAEMLPPVRLGGGSADYEGGAVTTALTAGSDARAGMPPAERPAPLELHVRVSIGVGCLSEGAELLEELYAFADAALYRAKALGRDRVAFRETMPQPSAS